MKKAKVVISWLLCVVMLLGVLPLSAYAAEDTEPTGELVEEIVYELMTDEELNEFSPYVDVAYAKELGHVMRLEEEETLNSLVFLNMDGSKSKYCFSSNIKYADENGNLVLIDSSTDLASIPAVMSVDSRSDIDKTVVYTNYNLPRYSDSMYRIGWVDNVFGTGYMLVRLNSFCENGEYTDYDPEQIMDVKLNIFGSPNPKYNLMACPYMGNDWEPETANCSNAFPSFSPLYASSATYAGYSLMYTFNLTEMTKAWLRGEYDSEKGICITTYVKDNTATVTSDYVNVYSNSAFSYVVTYSSLTTELTAANYEEQAGYKETEPNDTKATANIAVTKDRTTRTANSVIHGLIGYDPDTNIDDEVDWYAAYLQTGDTVNIKLYNINYAADLDMIVYNISGGTITSNNNTNGMAEYVTYTAINSGWIYIKVYGTVDQLSSYSLVIKRDIRVSGKGTYTASHSLYVTQPNNLNYAYRLGRDVADASCNIMFLGFGCTAVKEGQSSTGDVIYGSTITYQDVDYFHSFTDMKNYVRKFIEGYNANSSHETIGELAIMLSSAGTMVYGDRHNMVYNNRHLGEAFGEVIQELNNELSSNSKVKKIVAGFNFEIGENYDMTYTDCSDFEQGYASSFDNLSECLPMYVVADITGGLTSSSQITNADYSFDRGWKASEVFDVCAGDDFLRCIPQISLSNRIDRWMILYEWAAQEYWNSHAIGNNNSNRLIEIKPFKIYGIDCTNSFNDGENYNTNTVEKAMLDFVSRYYVLDSNMKSYFKYSTWMSMHEFAQLNFTN